MTDNTTESAQLEAVKDMEASLRKIAVHDALANLMSSLGLEDVTETGILFSSSFGIYSAWSLLPGHILPLVTLYQDSVCIFPVEFVYYTGDSSPKFIRTAQYILDKLYTDFHNPDEAVDTVKPMLANILDSIKNMETRLNALAIKSSRDTLQSLI